MFSKWNVSLLTVLWSESPMGLNLSRWAKRTTKKAKTLLRKRRPAKMLALQPGMDRLTHELSAQRDRHVRLQSVQTDIALDLPPSIPLPDGEEIPYGSSTRLQIRDPEQESEIHRKCVRAPPNRTIFDVGAPGAGPGPEWAGGPSGSGCQGASRKPVNLLGRTVRCLSGRRCQQGSGGGEEGWGRGGGKGGVGSVSVPSQRWQRLSAFSEGAGSSLASVPTVQCVSPGSGGGGSRSLPEEVSRSHSRCERTSDNKKKSKCDRSAV